MKIMQTLKNLWETVAYGPNCPHPEVQKQLEEKGYKFVDASEYVALPYGGYASHMMDIFNKEGQRVHYYAGEGDASDEYRKDYDQLLAARRAPKP